MAPSGPSKAWCKPDGQVGTPKPNCNLLNKRRLHLYPGFATRPSPPRIGCVTIVVTACWPLQLWLPNSATSSGMFYRTASSS